MNFFQAIKLGFKNYFNFSDRAFRSEYWYWALFNVLCFFLTPILLFTLNFIYFTTTGDNILSPKLASVIFWAIFAVTFIPFLSLSVRRLHDIDFRGWWLLLGLLGPASLAILIFHCLKGTVGDNRFGPDPLQKTPEYTSIKEVPNPTF